jgi:hypothetical protein
MKRAKQQCRQQDIPKFAHRPSKVLEISRDEANAKKLLNRSPDRIDDEDRKYVPRYIKRFAEVPNNDAKDEYTQREGS